jgi:hypothetical protein
MGPVSRRAVLQSAPFLVATLVRCTHALSDRTRVAGAFLVDPPWTAYQPTLRGVITAVLPFETPGFPPVTPDEIENRLVRLFPIEQETRFLGLQMTMVLFDELDLFTRMPAPLAQEEAKARDLAFRGGNVSRVLGEIAATDASAFASFVRDHGKHTQFRNLPLDARRAYLDLWRDSASIIKRQFFDALRSLIMVTTWSMDAAWPSIGYAGPLVPRTVTES